MTRLHLSTKTYWMLKKEVKEVMRSRWLIAGFIIAPLFAWIFEGFFLSFIVTQTAVEPEVVYITNNDNGPWGNNLYNNITQQKTNLKISQLITISAQEGQAMVDNKSVTVWVYIPANFSQQLETTTQSTLIIWVNSGSLRASSTASYIQAFSYQVVNAQITIRALTVTVNTVTPEATYGHQLAIFLVMVTSVLAPAPFVSRAFAGERERHTLEALLVVPMSRLKIMGAKVVAGVLLTLLYSVFTVVGILFYNWWIVFRSDPLPAVSREFFINLYTVNVTSIPIIFFCQTLVLLCAIGIGITISTIAKDQASSDSINNLVLLVPTFVVGILGFSGSIAQYGGLFGLFILAIPFTHAIIILNGVLSGVAAPLSIIGDVLYLVIFTVVFLVIGAKLFEREAIIS